MTSLIILWSTSTFVPIFFYFLPKWRFFAVILSCAYLCYFFGIDITIANDENLWGLLQTELEVSKNIFVIYKIIVLVLILALLFIAYRIPRVRIIVFVVFVLCNVLLPFNIMEKFLFGR